MIFKKAFATKFVLPVKEGNVKFYRSAGQYGLVHIKIPRKTGDHRSVCGIRLRKSMITEQPEIIAEVCARCLKGQYNYFEQDLPFDSRLWVEYFNDLSRVDIEPDRSPLDINIGELLEKQLEYEIEAIKAQNEIRQCAHTYLLYLMRYNKLFSLECHNCHEDITISICACDDPMVIDFVDTDSEGSEVNRDAFCLNCQGYLIENLEEFR